MFKPKTLSEIFKNSVNPDSEPSVKGKFYIETCRGKDAKHRVSTIILCRQGHNDILVEFIPPGAKGYFGEIKLYGKGGYISDSLPFFIK